MGVVNFNLPRGASPEAIRELERACLTGGPDNMPVPTELRFEPGQMIARRSLDESGYLVAPWDIPGAGRLMGTSSTLMERPTPYQLLLELARGKVNQVRCQASD